MAFSLLETSIASSVSNCEIVIRRHADARQTAEALAHCPVEWRASATHQPCRSNSVKKRTRLVGPLATFLNASEIAIISTTRLYASRKQQPKNFAFRQRRQFSSQTL